MKLTDKIYNKCIYDCKYDEYLCKDYYEDKICNKYESAKKDDGYYKEIHENIFDSIFNTRQSRRTQRLSNDVDDMPDQFREIIEREIIETGARSQSTQPTAQPNLTQPTQPIEQPEPKEIVSSVKVEEKKTEEPKPEINIQDVIIPQNMDVW